MFIAFLSLPIASLKSPYASGDLVPCEILRLQFRPLAFLHGRLESVQISLCLASPRWLSFFSREESKTLTLSNLHLLMSFGFFGHSFWCLRKKLKSKHEAETPGQCCLQLVSCCSAQLQYLWGRWNSATSEILHHNFLEKEQTNVYRCIKSLHMREHSELMLRLELQHSSPDSSAAKHESTQLVAPEGCRKLYV